MVALLPVPELQFIDADGKPIAGGTLTTYIPSTSTPKTTWVDPNQDAANTNPIVLDAAGRAIVFGDGAYRVILRDSAGNLIYDQISDTIVSAAMQPVMSAATIADAVNLLGIDALINAEATARANADSAEQAARIAADNAETARAEAAEANLQSQIDAINSTLSGLGGGTTVPTILSGFAGSDPSGFATVTFASPFTSTPIVVAQTSLPAMSDEWITVTSVTTTGFNVYTSQPLAGDILGPAPIGFYWIAVGS